MSVVHGHEEGDPCNEWCYEQEPLRSRLARWFVVWRGRVKREA